MQVFKYQAMTEAGQSIEGEIAAMDPSVVQGLLSNQGLTLVALRERRLHRFQLTRGRTGPEQLIEFTRSLASLLAAGIPLLQVLDDLQDETENRAWREMVHDVRLRIEGGASVSEALAAHPGTFDNLYISLVQAGEESGQIDTVLAKLADYLDWLKGVRDELRRAMSYPGLVLGALGGLIALLTFFVFPRLGGLFTSLEIELPLPTRVMLGIGHFGEVAWPFVLAGVVVGAVLLYRLKRTQAGQETLDRVSLRIPMVGDIVAMTAYSRFANTMATLIDAGVQLDRSLGLVEGAVGNRVVARAVAETRERIQSGESFSEALGRTGRFPRLVLRMVKVGETSGDMPAMLNRLTAYYEREMPFRVRKLVSAIGPITVFALAGTVIFAALSIFMPLLRITAAIK